MLNLLLGIGAISLIAFVQHKPWVWLLAAVLILVAVSAPLWLWVSAAVAIVVLASPLRAVLLSAPILWLARKLNLSPMVSKTEQEALSAGQVWLEREFFTGMPDMQRLSDEPYPTLSPEEKQFIDGPVETLCRMLNDWKVWCDRDLPPAAWEFIKQERFFGMIIPKEYGGLGLSATAHSEVLAKLASRSIPACVIVMVPNSLGPAELLRHYGTEEQKHYYLPRLARAEEIPCFALTEPEAGSDAASIQSEGTAFRGVDGKVYLRLDWNKRWITLSALSTLIGLAFRLKDPDNLLGLGTEPGITLALVPTRSAGITLDRRHDPLGVPFFNSPVTGENVIIPAEAIIGGAVNAGRGWLMIMESLGAGRGISLPALSAGVVKLSARVASSHAQVRRQFGDSIGTFEGIMEPLARISGFAYMIDACRKFTLGALDKGIRPPVLTAISKYNLTELSRRVINDAMDIQGGQGISKGPRNFLAHSYIAAPISITVEGANILTRTLMVFGQGLLRAHPFLKAEVTALQANDLNHFDKSFWPHLGQFIRNMFRVVILSLGRGVMVIPPSAKHASSRPVRRQCRKYWKKLSWATAYFAFLVDLAILSTGSKLKFKEALSGRFADVLSSLYMVTAILRRFESENRIEDVPLLRWSLAHLFTNIHQSLSGILANFPSPIVRMLLRPALWFLRMNPIGTLPSDSAGAKLANLSQIHGDQRTRLFGEIFVPTLASEPLARFESAASLSIAARPAGQKVRSAIRQKRLSKMPYAEACRVALEKGILTPEEFAVIQEAEVACREAIQVDDFSIEAYLSHHQAVEGYEKAA